VKLCRAIGLPATGGVTLLFRIRTGLYDVRVDQDSGDYLLAASGNLIRIYLKS